VYPGHPVRQSTFDNQVRSAEQEAAGAAGYGPNKKAEDQDRDLDVGSGQMLPLPMNEYSRRICARSLRRRVRGMEWNAL